MVGFSGETPSICSSHSMLLHSCHSSTVCCKHTGWMILQWPRCRLIRHASALAMYLQLCLAKLWQAGLVRRQAWR